jgi:hypothetical protein
MSTHCYQIAYEHAINEITEVNAQIESLTHRKGMLEKLLEPLNLLVSESGSVATLAYERAFERAIHEIAEIKAEIPRLNHRQELLEKALEPLKLLLPESTVPESAMPESAMPESAVAAIVAVDWDGSNREFSAPEAAQETAVIPEGEDGRLEAPAPVSQPEAQETDQYERKNGRYISAEDVAELAYRFWSEGGKVHGRHEDDWLRAAQELQHSPS